MAEMVFRESRACLCELGVPDGGPDTKTLVSGATFADGRAAVECGPVRALGVPLRWCFSGPGGGPVPPWR
ncbi:hypothetical protein GCM10010388_68850 [Streptomyces mauvecolor]